MNVETQTKPTREEKLEERRLKLEERKAQRAASGSKRAVATGLVPTLTSFDFLNGDYSISRNTRILSYALAGLVAAGLVLVLGLGITDKFATESSQQEYNTLLSERAALEADLAQNSDSGGLTEEQMNQHLTARANEAKTALGDEVNTTRILADVQAAAPAGVTVTGVSFAGASAPSAPGGEGATPATEGGITITTSTGTYPAIADWIDSLRSVTYLLNTDTKWSGSPSGDDSGGITVTTTASLSPELIGSRYNDVASRLGQVPTVPSAAPGATPTPGATP